MMRSMKWIPVPLDSGETMAHIVIPVDITPDETKLLMDIVEKGRPTVQRQESQNSAKEASTVDRAPSSALDLETKDVVDTATAAHYLNRKPQTLRIWASRESGPLQPTRINGRLAWPVKELRKCISPPS